MSKFKVGDNVIIREDLTAGNSYGGVYCNGTMAKLKGKSVVIVNTTVGGHFNISDDCDNWTWSAEMFRLNSKQTFKLTEESVRDLLKCPKGYVIECGDMSYSPYTIKEDGVYDKDDDQIDFIEFLTDLHEYDYEIKKESDYVVEMTLAEVCEKLGKNIKIIKE